MNRCAHELNFTEYGFRMPESLYHEPPPSNPIPSLPSLPPLHATCSFQSTIQFYETRSKSMKGDDHILGTRSAEERSPPQLDICMPIAD